MKNLFTVAAVATVLAAGSAGAATLDFKARATGFEQGFVNGTGDTVNGVNVTFESSHFAYYDSGAGLGVCKEVNNLGPNPSNGAANRCNTTSGSHLGAADDNVTTTEFVTVKFDNAFNVSNLAFDKEGHTPFLASSLKTLLFGTSSMALGRYTFGELMDATFNDVTSVTFAFDDDLTPGNNADEFYLSAMDVSAVPLPAGMALMLTALGGLGFASRRRKS